MRLPLIPVAELTPEQRELYADMKSGIETSFKGFRAICDNGSLIGPWNPWLHEPGFGKASWDLVKALASNPSLPKNVREVAILVTGTHFHSGYELYAHVLVGEMRGLSDEKISTIVAGCRPTDLTREEGVAYDTAFALVNGGVLPELLYKTAVETFTAHGAAELSYLVGLYCLVSVTLNTFDVPVPEEN
ncbi:carboxymuconolactone decarboxylase family protein [Methylocella sp.]|uniref:carboxymuconolactone decarboxylase family protein n=1 Tax=Methylocella sp. TaxID=1978226 RepID=UPI003783B9EC